MRNVGEVFSSSFFSVGKKSMQRLGKKERNRSFLRYISHKVITFKCYCCCFSVEFPFFPLFSAHSQPSSMFLSQHQQAFNIDFFGVSSSTLCVDGYFISYFFRVVVYCVRLCMVYQNKREESGRIYMNELIYCLGCVTSDFWGWKLKNLSIHVFWAFQNLNPISCPI